MVTRCGLGNCERVCQASRVESLDGSRQALEQESCFSPISRRIRQAPSDLRQELPSTDTRGPRVCRASGNVAMLSRNGSVIEVSRFIRTIKYHTRIMRT